jgi:limonene 1,2-monooxygenase
MFPVFVASTLSPAGPTIAGKHGVGVISVSTFLPAGLDLKAQWALAEESAAKNGKTMSRRNWRLMLPIYLADSREEAYRDVSVNAFRFQDEYFGRTLGRAFEFPGAKEDFAQVMAETGGAIIGTPEDAVTDIKQLQELSGGFGGLLGLAHEWAPSQKMHHSYELFARYVAPHFQGGLAGVTTAQGWASANREALNKNEVSAVVAAFNTLGGALPEQVYGEKTS